ncbi:DNA (cytosine-5-)-methyltransferase [Rhodanobacter umsongensis]|uniref:Cytosine-specific methyltransferase n=1 Tax=Rhodanobacter umsongensis TaxID=633153 RepID=A0ABW0JJ10_9GAMM
MTIDRMTTGAQLRQRRERLGLSQAKLAEISGVSQHLLSAFELGKVALAAPDLAVTLDAIRDSDQVMAVSTRTKRYRERCYSEPPMLAARVAKAKPTRGNPGYVALLRELHAAHCAPKTADLSALSLFSGCGGFSLGFSAAGFSIKGFVEREEPLRAIYRQNFSDGVEIGADITAISDGDLAARAAEIGPIDVIIGGPPCQGFSLSGKRKVDDPRNQLFRHYLRFVDMFRPKMAVLENVRVLTSMRNAAGGLVRDDIRAEFGRHGYKVDFFEVNAKDYGVPQHRERVLFVAVRNDLPGHPSMPAATHGSGGGLFPGKLAWRTFADACSDLAYLESGGRSSDSLHEAVSHPSHVIEWLWDVPEGSSAHDNSDPQMRPPSGYNTTYKRQVWNEPAATVQTTFGMISGCRNVHPVATRALTIREAARLQSFPDTYRFGGTLGCIRTGIGNAVPPLLARAIAMHVRRML